MHKDLQLPDRKLLESVAFLWIVSHTQTGAAGNVHVINDIGWHSGSGSERRLSLRLKSGPGSRSKVFGSGLELSRRVKKSATMKQV